MANASFLLKQTVDWTVPKPGGGVNEYMEILVKETTTLHRVLSRYLALSVVEVRRFLFLPLPMGNLVVYSTDPSFLALPVCNDSGIRCYQSPTI